MEWKIERASVEGQRLAADIRLQAIVDGEAALPGSLRDAATVLSVQARAVPGAGETQGDKVVLSGQVLFDVLYAQGDLTRVQCIETACDFRQIADAPGVTPRMALAWDVCVEDAQARASGGRLMLTAALSLYAIVTADAAIEAVTDVTGDPALRTRCCQARLQRTTGRGEARALVREEFELPAALGVQDTLYATADARVDEVVGGEGRVTVSGTVELTVCHAGGESRPLVITRHSAPFEQSVALEAGEEDAVGASVRVLDVMADSMEAGEDARVLRTEVELLVRAQATHAAQRELLCDVYTISGDLAEPTRREERLMADGAGERARESGKIVLALPDDAPPVGTMLAAFVQPAAGTRERSGGRLRVDGMMGVTLVYLPIDSQVPVSTRQDAPMSVQFACGLSADAAIALECVEAVASAITSDRVEVRFILSMEGMDCGAQPLQVVTDVTRTPAQAEPGAIVVYYPAQDETAWDVAKRYRVDAQSLRALNPQLEEARAGEPVVVLRRGAAEA